MTSAFTTFQVARFCGVFHTTVINWANRGKIKHFKTPGGHRRFTPRAVRSFIRRHRFPMPNELRQ